MAVRSRQWYVSEGAGHAPLPGTQVRPDGYGIQSHTLTSLRPIPSQGLVRADALFPLLEINVLVDGVYDPLVPRSESNNRHARAREVTAVSGEAPQLRGYVAAQRL